MADDLQDSRVPQVRGDLFANLGTIKIAPLEIPIESGAIGANRKLPKP
jgi:hypothetical protein